jgi:hypothetical protein
VLLERVEVAANGRLRHAKLADEFIERRETADADDVDKPAATLVVLHDFRLQKWQSMNHKRAKSSRS